MIAIAAVFVLGTGGIGLQPPPFSDQSVAIAPPGLWNLNRWISLILSGAVNVLIMLLMLEINSTFNVLRAMTRLQIGLYALMQAATPGIVLGLNSGTILALVVLAGIYLMFSCYDEPDRVRRVFLTFLMLSLGATFQIAFIIFVPVFWLITMQMRIFTLRTFLASLLGMLTVWIILLGFELVLPADFRWPEVDILFRGLDVSHVVYTLIVVALTVALLLGSTMLNVMKTIAYNARSRAFNGALTLVALVAVAAAAVNFGDLSVYIPLINVCAAYQITHYLVNHRFDRQYAVVMSVAAVYIVLYLWRITI